MAKSKFDKIWYLLSNNAIEIEGPISEDFICTICRNICVEPYAALCGCQFCSSCIKNYLINDTQLCPGDKEECRSEYLELDKNVMRDLKTTRSLAKVIVKCPNKLCDFKTKLEKLDKHLLMCTMPKTNTFYKGFDSQDDEMKTASKFHSDLQLLIGNITNLRKDVNELQLKLELRDQEIVKLKDDSNTKEMMIIDMKDKMEAIADLVEYLQQVNLIKETELNEIKEDINKKEIDMNTVLKCNSIEPIKTNIYNNLVECTPYKAYINRLSDKIKSHKEENNKSIIDTHVIMKEIRFNSQKEFYWTIDNFSVKQKEEQKLRSAPFYKDSYKLHLFVSFVENNLRVLCHILKGEFDAYIDWPMKKKVTLSILDQDTANMHTSNAFQFDSYPNKSVFNRPQTTRNEGFGNNKFSQINDLINVKGLLRNDSLILSCVVDD